MSIEHRCYRSSFQAGEVVLLRQVCFSSAGMFAPGKYIAGELPPAAFEMGLVDRLPPVRGKSEEIGDPPQPRSAHTDSAESV